MSMTRQEFVANAEGCQRELRRFLTALCCGNSPDADDIAQETFLKAYLSSGTLADKKKFKSWIFSIAYRTFVDRQRVRKDFAGYDALESVSSEYQADDRLKYQDLHAALRRLPSRERTAVLLYYIEGYSTEEIAVIIKTTIVNVRQMLSRGRGHLKELIVSK